MPAADSERIVIEFSEDEVEFVLTHEPFQPCAMLDETIRAAIRTALWIEGRQGTVRRGKRIGLHWLDVLELRDWLMHVHNRCMGSTAAEDVETAGRARHALVAVQEAIRRGSASRGA